MLSNPYADFGPKFRESSGDRTPVPLKNRRFIDIVLVPGASAINKVTYQWLQSIDCASKTGLVTLACFEFLPQSKIFRLCIWGEEPENATRCGDLGQKLGLFRLAISMQWRITCIDLDEIVNEEHFDGLQHIDRSASPKAQGKECEMPGVFGRVLSSAAAQKARLPIDTLQTIDLNQKCEIVR